MKTIILMWCVFVNCAFLEGKNPTPDWFLHHCRNSIYVDGGPKRTPVPDNFVNWTTKFDYKPVYYESPILQIKEFCDPFYKSGNFNPKYNALDGNIDRVSYHGHYQINEKELPMNPFGRTGIGARGKLNRYGPNHCGDAIVTTWKRDANGTIVLDKTTNKKCLQLIVIFRGDTNEMAVPGGKKDPGEGITQTIYREFIEEALNNKKHKKTYPDLEEFFTPVISGQKSKDKQTNLVYSGYVDDPRNTDNAWMETTAVNFHDETGKVFNSIKGRLEGGDDATSAVVIDVTKEIHMFANHKKFVENTAQILDAHW